MTVRKRASRPAQHVEEFRRLAEEYCRLITDHQRIPIRDLLRALHRVLPALYATGLRLSESVPTNKPQCELMSNDEWWNLFQTVRRRLGNRDAYREVFDVYDRTKNDVVIGSLADDLSDIYRELLDGLRYWNAGEREYAVWQWRFGLDCHWGAHATDAMRAMHSLEHNHKFGPPGAMPNNTLQRTHSRVTPRAKHGSRRAARR